MIRTRQSDHKNITSIFIEWKKHQETEIIANSRGELLDNLFMPNSLGYDTSKQLVPGYQPFCPGSFSCGLPLSKR